MGRPRSPSVDLPTSPPIPSVIRQRRSSSTVAKKLPQSASNPSFLRKQGSSSSLSNGLWTDCIEVVNEIGVMAKMESRSEFCYSGPLTGLTIHGDSPALKNALKVATMRAAWTDLKTYLELKFWERLKWRLLIVENCGLWDLVRSWF